MQIVVAITGASGAIIGIRLLQALQNEETYLIISENAEKIIKFETEYELEDIKNMAKRVYINENMEADIASGTTRFDSFVISPCSTSTLSKIACGIADNLITRVASVALKERRKIILVPRETPISPIILENMLKLSKLGVRIIPPVPAFYLKPKKIEEVVDYIVGKILDSLGSDHNLYKPYSPQ